MDKFLKYLMLLLVITFSLTFTSCGKDDDEPGNPGGSSSTKQYEVRPFTIDNGATIAPFFVDDDGNQAKFCDVNTRCDYETDNKEIIGFSSDYYTSASNIRMARCNDISSLSQITSISGLSWIDYPINHFGYESNRYRINVNCYNLEEKTGFILEGTFLGRTYYIRIYISEFNRNSAGTIIGINGFWQQFRPQ